MNICPGHWTQLRRKIEERGLGQLIAPDGETAAAQMRDQLERGSDEGPTPANFDPLMSAWAAIGSNVAKAAGPNALYLLVGGVDAPRDPIDFEQYANGRATMVRLSLAGLPLTWPRCGICHLSIAHELTCTEAACTLPKVDGYDYWLDRAADGVKEQAEELGLVGP